MGAHWYEVDPRKLLTPQPFKRQPHKMAKRTQTIRRQIADKLPEYVCPFRGIGAERDNFDPPHNEALF